MELCFMRQKRNACIEGTHPMAVDMGYRLKTERLEFLGEPNVSRLYITGQFNYVLLLSVCDMYMTPIKRVSKSS